MEICLEGGQGSSRTVVPYGTGLDASGSGQGSLVCSYEHGNKSSRSVTFREYLGCLSDCNRLKDSAPWSLLVS
jgi:hypothetical protein